MPFMDTLMSQGTGNTNPKTQKQMSIGFIKQVHCSQCPLFYVCVISLFLHQCAPQKTNFCFMVLTVFFSSF
jgi:hypothetical protein